MKSSKSLVFLSSCALGFALSGCGSSGPEAPKKDSKTPENKILVDAAKQSSLFPFKEGNSWTYAVEIQRQLNKKPRENATLEMEYRVTKVTKDGGFTKATLAIMQNNVKKDEQVWGMDDKGIYQVAMRSSQNPYNPKQPVLRFPVKDQDEFKWDGSGLTPVGKMGQMTYAFKVDGLQDADTEMGSMHCVYMQSAGSFKNTDKTVGIIAVNSWFAPGIGLARYRQVIKVKEGESAITLRLKRYTVK